MKKNNKGISLISLVVIIIATIILISVVVTAGYEYIQEANRKKTTAVVKLVSDAAKGRQSDKQMDISAPSYYVGHPFKTDNVDQIKGLPEGFATKAEDIWYLIDAKSAKELGVLETEKYLENDLKNPSSETATVVLVNYVTGEAYLVEIKRELLGGSIADSFCNQSAGGTHLYSIQTCIKGSLCINCGAPNVGHEEPLGHEYSEPTCTLAAICIRCEEIDITQPAKGHIFEVDDSGNEKWTTDATRHWKECSVCKTKKDSSEHNKGYVRIDIGGSNYDPQYHKEVCSECGWESVKTEHKIKYEILSDNTHRRYCELCEYSVEHTDSGWIHDDEEKHWKECEEGCPTSEGGTIDCIDGNKLFSGAHEDNNNDNVCDICQKVLDNQPPNSFTSIGSYAKLDEATTSTLKVSAYTQDNLEMAGYKFAIDENKDGIIDWNEISLIESGDGIAGEITFNNLRADTVYDIYVIGIDIAGNQTEAYKIPDTVTQKLPEVNVVGIPNDYVSNEFTVTFETNTTLPNIKTEYSTDGGKTWIEGSSFLVTEETVNLEVRAKDNYLNVGNSNSIIIDKLDKTAPTITITEKAGDNASVLKTQHTAVVNLSDSETKIKSETTIRYAWSLSNTTPPSTYEEVTTTNVKSQENVSVEINTPAGVMGEYYLWIDEGVSDAGNNKTTEPVCSESKFNVDDMELTLSNIRMYNPTPEIAGEGGFVKTDGTIMVVFASGKELANAPKVIIGGIQSSDVKSTDKINWTATVKATELIPEGEISLNISEIYAISGKAAQKNYTQDDLIEGPVIYDKTLPKLEYIDKI